VARVLPFRAVRYSAPEGSGITPLTGPPYDVISPALREDLLERDRHNVVALELPEGSLDPSAPGNRYETGGRRWRQWLEERVLVFDAEPAVYVVEQRYRHDGEEIARRGFVAAVGLEPFSAGVVLPHERTLPKAIADRLDLTRATAANLSQVFGMFADPGHSTDELIDRAMATPFLVTATDDDGVVSTVWALTGTSDQQALASFMADRPIFIADGHHRYTTALAYRDERAAAEPPGTGTDRAYQTVMMALVNMDDPGLVVYPTHRIVDAPAPLDPVSLREAISRRFELSGVSSDDVEGALRTATDRPSFIVRTRDGVTMLAQLRGDVDHSTAFPPGTSEHWRNLDVAALQELVMSPLLDVHPDRPETLERLSFSKDAHAALETAGRHDAVFVLRATRMDQVAAVASAGETMPQKSTYFYPKLLSGLLFKSLDRL
jgi:uncharacterized protein (DUF1015 family)